MDMETYLNQGRVWIDRDGREREIADMEPLHRKNAAKWLVRNAGPIWQAYELVSFRNTIIAFDASDVDTEPDVSEIFGQTTDELVATLAAISKPDEWIQTTELYRALMSGVRPGSDLSSLLPGGADVVYRASAGTGGRGRVVINPA